MATARSPQDRPAVGAIGGFAGIGNDFVQLLAQAPRQGAVHLGVGAGRTLSPALGAAEAEAAKMAVYLGTRERLGHKVCWVLCAQHLM